MVLSTTDKIQIFSSAKLVTRSDQRYYCEISPLLTIEILVDQHSQVVDFISVV